MGDEAARFVVHEELFTYHSPYFCAALKGGFAEAADGAVRLQEADPVVFEIFVHWLYYARLPNKDDAPKLFNLWARLDNCGQKLCDSLVRLYVLCDKYDVPALRRHCLDQLFAHYDHPNTDSVQLATLVYTFQNAPSDSHLCRFVIDFFCHYGNAEEWSEACERHETAPPLALLSSALQRYTKYAMEIRRSNEGLRACDYHEHKDGEEHDECAAKRADSG